MDSQWREKKLYPIVGAFAIVSLLYLNFKDNLHFTFPEVVRNLPEMGFVGVNHTRFLLLDDAAAREFYVNGWNSYWLMEESARRHGPARRRVSEMLRKGADLGMTVCRTWAFSDGGGGGADALQLKPGVFNDRVFKALDYVVMEARRHKVRLILSLVNNLKAYGGKTQYLQWAEAVGINVSSKDSFFSDPSIKAYYKSYVKAILTRRNSFTGVKYSDEPSIFAWELMNEPRCDSVSSAPTLQAWIAEMAAYVKSLDRNHLVTIGLEGFYASKSSKNYETNPGDWAASLGSDFLNNSAIKDIDFASVHAYPHSWIPEAKLEAKVKYLSKWADAHISDGENLLKKPVLFTEVGALSTMEKAGLYDRDVLFKTIYDKIYNSARKRGAGGGVLIWQLLVDGVEEYSDEFSFVAGTFPSTRKLILHQSCRLRYASNDTERCIYT
ncbi:mannan endo-1,4-beta-mannosidase 6-like [Andrographis paniculata]|uniref:mannan endo-1,4-beta-mannosidase 6-like n=1 Tax=Andrographis paniculata TaxID=175694 RepID=UPI0021E80C48|nr:mannan endo-1,4-beta-mannosidase 6-like [Andrographis paniculata]